MFMDGILLYSRHCNKYGIFSWLIFVGVSIWAPRESSRKSFPQGSNVHGFFWTHLHPKFYLGNLEAALVSSNRNFPQGYDVYGGGFFIFQTQKHNWYIWLVGFWCGDMGSYKAINPLLAQGIIAYGNILEILPDHVILWNCGGGQSFR